MELIERYQDALQKVLSSLQGRENPEYGIVLGTGLGNWVRSLEQPIAIPYGELPGFPRSTVQTHSGELVHGYCGSRPVFVLKGRFHLYEGYSPKEVVTGVRLLALLGVKKLIVTNASGAINPHFHPGTIMIIIDHINMTGQNPLQGPNIDEWGPRFPDMSRVYDEDLINLTRRVAIKADISLERGIYVGVTGPSLETPAETRAYRGLGGDAIGMSTVMETIAAKHMGLKILGLSCLTNRNLPDCMQETSFEEIVQQAEKTGKTLEKLLTALVPVM